MFVEFKTRIELTKCKNDRNGRGAESALAESVGIESSKRSFLHSDHDAGVELTTESRLPTLGMNVRHHLLKGDIDNLPAIQSRVIRIYISSHYYGTLYCRLSLLAL